MIPDNDWYGHKFILSLYAGLDRPRPIFGTIRHGWHPDWLPGLGERKITSAPVFAWNERHETQASELGIPNVICIGAPFAYLHRMLSPTGSVPAGKGTLVFPAHSAEGVSPIFSSENLVEQVIAEFPAPYTVSVFYQDLESPQVDVYTKAGWRVVSFGDRSNRLFLFRQYSEICSHEYLVANTVHSALWYGSLLGRRCRVVSESREESLSSTATVTSTDLLNRWPHFADPVSNIELLLSLGQEELGFGRLLTPTELKSALGWDSSQRRLIASTFAAVADKRFGKAARRGELRF